MLKVVPKSKTKSQVWKFKKLEMNISHWAAELWVRKRVNVKVDMRLDEIRIKIKDNIYIDVVWFGERLIAYLEFNNQETKIRCAEAELEQTLNQLYQLTQTQSVLAA